MKRLCLLALNLAVIAIVGSHAYAASRSQNLILGVNVEHPERADETGRAQLLDSLQKSGVHFIRVGVINDASIQFVKDAFKRGIKTDLIVHPELPAGSGHLSQASEERLRTVFGPRLDALDSAGVTLVALEFGNEINHPDFNADLDGQRGINLGAQDLVKDPEGMKVSAGFDAYIRSLKVLKELRDRSTANRSTPIITAGLAALGPAGVRPGGKRDAVNLAATLGYLRQAGLDSLVDGYAVHVYPVTASTADEVASLLRNDSFSICSSNTKLCWVTEWAVMSRQLNEPENENQRARAVGNVMSAFHQMEREGRLSALFYYEWVPEPWHHGGWDTTIYRNGVLTESGKIALSPM